MPRPWRPDTFCPEALRYWRQKARLRQKDIAAALGVSQPTVKGYEAGRYAPTGESIVAIVKLLGCNLGDLFAPPPEPAKRKHVRSQTPIEPVEPRPPLCPLLGLAAIREQRGMSQMDAANFLHVSAGSINRWENGGKTSWANVERFAKMLGVHPAALVVAPEMVPKYHRPWCFRANTPPPPLGTIG